MGLKKSKIAVASLMALACIATASLSACNKDSIKPDDVVTQKFDTTTRINGKTFGTFYHITVPGGYPGGEKVLKNDAEFVFTKVADAISTFDANAEIARFNETKNTKPFVISHYLARVLEEMFLQSRRIDGAMDPTVEPLVDLWGFGPSGEIEKSPSEEQIAAAKKLVGVDKVSIRYAGDTAYLVKSDPDVQLDLSTIGEGLAADELAELMDEKGVSNYMIAIAGAIRSHGANPDGKLWRVGIEDPMGHGQKTFVPVCPQNMAISTAGTYHNFFMDHESGEFFSHIIDPNTGRPVSHRTVSVTVIDRLSQVTDALDTGLLVMGATKAIEWAEKNGMAVYTIEVDEKGKPQPRYSKAFEPYLKCELKPGTASLVTVQK